ncbi:MAG: hypothetical protein IJX65_04195 [Alistipes sp.]|nr:hypothetical protein [Alistipes sp.]
MSNIVTDELLCRYMADSGSLTEDELAAVHCHLSANPSEFEMVHHITSAMTEADMEIDGAAFAHTQTLPYTDAQIAERQAERAARAMAMVDDILEPRTEQELIAHFGITSAEGNDRLKSHHFTLEDNKPTTAEQTITITQ